MDQRALNAGITQEEVMAALVTLGEDPTASRVAALHARIDANSLPAGGREEAVRSAVDAARRVSDAVPAARLDSAGQSSTLAGRHKVGDVVYPRGLHLRGRIVEEDTLNDSSPRIPGEKLWILRFDDGRSGGGWRDGELEKVPGEPQLSRTAVPAEPLSPPTLNSRWQSNGLAWRYLLMAAAGAIPGGYAEDSPPPIRLDILSQMRALAESGWNPNWTEAVSYFSRNDTMAHRSEMLQECKLEASRQSVAVSVVGDSGGVVVAAAKKQFSATWNEAFVKPGTRVLGEEFFTVDAGYYEEEIREIQGLAVGQSWKGHEYSDGHMVTRLLDVTNSLEHVGGVGGAGLAGNKPMPTPDEVRDQKLKLAEDRLARRMQSATSIAASDSALRDHRAILQRIEAEHSAATKPASGADEGPSPDL